MWRIKGWVWMVSFEFALLIMALLWATLIVSLIEGLTKPLERNKEKN